MCTNVAIFYCADSILWQSGPRHTSTALASMFIIMYCVYYYCCVCSVVLSSCSWSLYTLCMCLCLLGLSARAVVTGCSLCLARGQHTFDVFIIQKIRGGGLREKFFLRRAKRFALVKTPTKSISDFGRRFPTLPVSETGNSGKI